MSRCSLLALISLLMVCAAAAPAPATPVNLLSIQEGTFPVVEPESYGGWVVEALLDDSPTTGWACPEGKIAGNVFVFEMAAEATIERFEFDAASVDEDGAGAKEVVVEVSTASKNEGFAQVLQATLAVGRDRQSFDAAKRVPARWVRLTIRTNQGNESWTELFGFRGYGERPPFAGLPEGISGTYATDYNDFHVRQQGTALVGCYEYDSGVLDGAIEGRVMKITWFEKEDRSESGPAVMVFTPDGKAFRGFWWHSGAEAKLPNGEWNGTKTSATVGACPHWSGSVGGELTKASRRPDARGSTASCSTSTRQPSGRVEARPRRGRGLARGPADLAAHDRGPHRLDRRAEHNRVLSQQRAESVKAYLGLPGSTPRACRRQASGRRSRSPTTRPSSAAARTAGSSWCETSAAPVTASRACGRQRQEAGQSVSRRRRLSSPPARRRRGPSG